MLAYHLFRALCKPVEWICIPSTVLHRERLDVGGPCVLAPTHNSHLEPFVLSLLLRGQICWMARREFYTYRPFAFLMNSVGAFKVSRGGYARPPLRDGLRLLSQGERVGVFPEGGVARRHYSAMRGGPITHGACFLGMHGQVPIIPIAIVGTHAMNRVTPWLPYHRLPVHAAIGEPIEPGSCPESLYKKRKRRNELGAMLSKQYIELYQELLALPGVDDDHDLHPGQSDDPAHVRCDPVSAAGIAAAREARKANLPSMQRSLSSADV